MSSLLRQRWFLPVFIFVLAVVGFWLRWQPGADELVFPYDQSRDVLFLRQAVDQRDPILIGPITDIPGIYHGPLFYYVLIPLYLLSQWQPIGALVGFIVINLLTLITLAYATEKMFRHRPTTLTALLLFTFSYEAISYARWLSNPVLVIPLMPVVLLWSWQLWHKQKTPHLLLGVTIGLITQAEIVLGYLFLLNTLFYYFKRRPLPEWIKYFSGFFIGVLPFVIAEMKFKGQTFRAVQGFLSQQQLHTGSEISGFLFNLLDIWGQIFRNSILGFTLPAAIVGLAALLITGWWLSKQYPQLRFLVIFWLSSIFLFILGKHVAIFFMAGFMIVLILLAARIMSHLWVKYPQLVLGLTLICILTQFWLVKKAWTNHLAYVFIQENVLLDQRLAVLRTIQEKSHGQEWTISVLGTPYGVRTPWSYYTWLAQQRFGLTSPKWFGFVANGFVGDELLPKTDHPAELHFTIIEPTFDIDEYSVNTFMTEQNQATELIEEWETEGHTVQLRKPR